MFSRLKNFEQDFSITKAAFIVGFFAFLSKLVALVRDPLFASEFGGEKIYILDVYAAAFRIPDFIFSIFILGTLSVALIPIFVDLKIKNEKKANEFANTIITGAILLMGGIFGLVFIFARPLTAALVPGFSPDLLNETVTLTRIIALSQIIFTLSNICTNILYATKRFIIAGIAPILYNVGIIAGILVFYPRVGIKGLGLGVLLGAACHLLIQLPELTRSCLRLAPVLNLKTEAVRQFFKLYLPRIFAIDLPVFSLLIAAYIGSNLPSGSIGIFTLCVNLLSLPVSIIALSLATAIFPALSESYSKGREEDFLSMLKKTIVQVLYFMVPLTLLMIIFRAQGVRLYLGHGNFTWDNTILTFTVFGILAFALVSQSLSPILARAFYSRQNTITPLVVNLGALAINSLLAFVLKDHYGILGVAAAFSIASIFNAITLFIVLRSALYKTSLEWFSLKKFDDELVITSLKIILASVLMGLASYGGLYLLELPLRQVLEIHTVIGLLLQVGGAATLGIVVFFVASTALKLKESQIILDYLKKVTQFLPFYKN